MPYIGKQPLTGAYQLCDTITTSATATYNLLVGGSAVIPGSANNCIVSLNGVVQAPVSAFTVSGSTITFASTLSATDVIDFILILGNVFDIGTPTNGAVGTSQLATNLTVTHALGAVGTPSITFTGDTNTGIYSPTADTIAFTEGGTEAMRIDSSGRLGLGITSPETKLHVGGLLGSGSLNGYTVACIESPDYAILTLKSPNANFSQILFTDTTTSALGSITYGNSSSGDANTMRFNVNNAERMRINSTGKILMNTTASVGPEKITMNYDSNSGPGLAIKDTTPQNGNTFIDFYNNTTQAGTITSNGTTTIYYNTSSDYRLKENVNYNFDAITRLKQLKPARFNFIGDENRTVDGFIAHEIQEIIPEVITGKKDAVQVWRKGEELPEGLSVGDNKLDKNGNTIPIYQGIDQSKLTPILTKALQEAIAKIESLETRLTALENN